PFCALATRSGYGLPSVKRSGSVGARWASHSSSMPSSRRSWRHRGAPSLWCCPHWGHTSKFAASASAVIVPPQPPHLRKIPLPKLFFSLASRPLAFFVGQGIWASSYSTTRPPKGRADERSVRRNLREKKDVTATYFNVAQDLRAAAASGQGRPGSPGKAAQ